jgi:hypothetical protein
MSARTVENARGNFKEVQQVDFVFAEPDTSFRNNLPQAACLPPLSFTFLSVAVIVLPFLVDV